MDAYVYAASLLCRQCGEARRAELPAPTDPHDESSYDSADYPQGPYRDGGGEADSPQACDACGVALENPLTSDGIEYVLDAVLADPCGWSATVRDWIAEHYDELRDALEERLRELGARIERALPGALGEYAGLCDAADRLRVHAAETLIEGRTV